MPDVEIGACLHRILSIQDGMSQLHLDPDEIGGSLETGTTRLRRAKGMLAAAITAAAVITMAFPVYGYTSKPGNTAGIQEAETADGSLSFGDAIDTLYAGSSVMSDEMVLETARRISSEGDLLYSELNAEDARAVMETLSKYEETKADYIKAEMNASAGLKTAKEDMPGSIYSEWGKQVSFSRMTVTEDSSVRELIPRFRVTGCREEDGLLSVDVDEWMTQAYGCSGDSGATNASAYSYAFSISLQSDGEGTWMPCGVNGTEINFAWLEGAEDPVAESVQAPQALYEVKSDLGTQTAAYASITAEEPGKEDTAGKERKGKILSFAVQKQAAVLPDSVLEDGAAGDSGVYEASRGYSYQISRAIAYADRYWKHYNHSYHNYANEGGDCANFVSQCLYAGGMPRTDDWFPQSVNWINVMGHIRHFKAYGSFLTASNSNVSAGNPVYYDWNRDGIYDHTTICVGVNSSGMPVVDSHTANLYHAPWKMGSHANRGTIRLHGTGAPSGGSSRKNSWETVGGKTYYIGPDGKRVKNRFLTINGARYYFNSSGERVTGFFKVGSYWHYASVKNGKMLTGFQWIAGNTYYFSVKNYARLTGRQWIAGFTYYFNEKGIRQYGFLKINGKYYYAAPKTGRFVKGWKQIGGKWYFFDRQTMVRAAGWKVVDGHRCYFDSQGVLRKGWHG